MKSEINVSVVQSYPMLKIHDDGDIVLFITDRNGTVVKWGGRSQTKEGVFIKDWSTDGWSKFTGSVTLSND